MLFLAPVRLSAFPPNMPEWELPNRPDPTGLCGPLHVCVFGESTTWQSVIRERDPRLPREI